MNADKRRSGTIRPRPSARSVLVLFVCVYLWLISSCSSKPTDLRTLAPADSLVYLETNDLGAALQPIVDGKPFTEAAKSKPDLSALKGVQVAVAVTGFETSEEKLTDEHSVGKVQPHFVAIADTHAWNFQAVGFAEKKLGSFVANLYDSEPKLEEIDKNGGKHFTWTAEDGRKAYALVIDSLIYFTNDETSIDKCLAVRRGEADSIAKTGKIQPAQPGTLASGYISTDGVAQIANIAALKLASDASDESEVQSAIASLIPQLIRGTVTDVSWAQTKTDAGIEDKWQIQMPQDVAAVYSEIFKPGSESDIAKEINNALVAQLPVDTQVATRYNLKDPLLAWQNVALVSRRMLPAPDQRILTLSVPLLFESYGIADPERFLASLPSDPYPSRNIVTARLSEDADEVFVIKTHSGGGSSVLGSLAGTFIPAGKIVEEGLNVWDQKDGDLQLRIVYDRLALGPKTDLARFDGPRFSPADSIRKEPLRRLAASNAPITTVGTDRRVIGAVVAMMTNEDHSQPTISEYFTETRFTRSGMERKTTSDFGFIGWIIAQQNDE